MTLRARYKTIEFWVALLGALAAMGIIGADVPIGEWAEIIVGAIGIGAAFLAKTRD